MAAADRLDLSKFRNLGIIANIQGDHEAALALYQRSLEACNAANECSAYSPKSVLIP